MVKFHKPRSGSLQFVPHRRAKSETCKIREWPKKSGMLGFSGYKAGMVHYIFRDTNPKSATKGRSLSAPATIIEVPPVKVIGVNFYRKQVHGYNKVGCAKKAEDIEKTKCDFLTLLLQTQPALAGFPKKKSEDYEIAIGGDYAAQLAIAKERLGKTISASDIFKTGDYTDVTAVSRGHGVEGPIMKFGMKIFREKMEKSYRKPGHIGSGRTPCTTPWWGPMAGKIGYHQRTEINKMVLAINKGLDKKEFARYGMLGENYLILDGSIPGPRKRLIRVKPAMRPPAKSHGLPEILQIVV